MLATFRSKQPETGVPTIIRKLGGKSTLLLRNIIFKFSVIYINLFVKLETLKPFHFNVFLYSRRQAARYHTIVCVVHWTPIFHLAETAGRHHH